MAQDTVQANAHKLNQDAMAHIQIIADRTAYGLSTREEVQTVLII